MRKNIVAVFVFKKNTEGRPGVFVADFDNEQKFKEWAYERDYLFSHIARTKGEVFRTIREVEEFKNWLRGLLCIGPKQDFDDEKFAHFLEIEDGMEHYKEKDFDKAYIC